MSSVGAVLADLALLVELARDMRLRLAIEPIALSRAGTRPVDIPGLDPSWVGTTAREALGWAVTQSDRLWVTSGTVYAAAPFVDDPRFATLRQGGRVYGFITVAMLSGTYRGIQLFRDGDVIAGIKHGVVHRSQIEAAKPSVDLTTDDRASWVTVFGRSRTHPALFTVRDPEAVKRVVAELRLPTAESSSVFSSSYSSACLLDGLILELFTYGLPLGGFQSGTRVLGFRPMRLLCELLELHPPRRLRGERSVPLGSELRRDLAAQLELPREMLEVRARLGLDVATRHDLMAVADRLWPRTRGSPRRGPSDRLAGA